MTARRFEVRWADSARTDLLGIIGYLATADAAAADRLLGSLEKKAASLERFPVRGRLVPELVRFQVRLYRELQAPPYRLIYRVREHSVLVLAVLDGRRDLEDLLLDRLLRE